MAINQWAAVTIDPAAAVKPDRADHHHTASAVGADALNLTVAWDSAVITTMSKWDSCVAAARRIAAGQLPA